MPTDYFFLTEQIVAEEKYFDISIDEILRRLMACGECELEAEHHVRDDFANEYTIVLRLNINCKNDRLEAWTIALKLHKKRIDGIDWEPFFTGTDGQVYTGWHRHRWNHKLQNADIGKVPYPELRDVRDKETFLLRTFSSMSIRVNARDVGNDELPFD